MASISTGKNGRRRIIYKDTAGIRRCVRLGILPLRAAKEIKAKVEAILAARAARISMDPETATWLGLIDDTLYEKLAAVQLVPPRGEQAVATLAAFLDAYIELRADVKPSTKAHLKRARRNLVEFFGAKRPIDEITPADADEFRLHLAETMDASSTVPRICGRAKQFFRYAVRKKLIPESPFGDMKGVSVKANKEREFFVTQAMARRVLDACPDNEWRLLFALCRFGGLRCPSEPLALRWGDMDWERSRMHVRSPKTEHHDGKDSRWVPMFPELRPYLDAAYDAAKPGTEHVITRYRDANANLRTQFNRIVRKAGLEPWQKPFQNLRSTRETELAESFPIHVVCAWIGNSEAVAAKHYLQVTDEHFAKAAHQATRAPAVSSHPQPSGETADPSIPAENADFPVLVDMPSSPGRTRTFDKPVNRAIRGSPKNPRFTEANAILSLAAHIASDCIHALRFAGVFGISETESGNYRRAFYRPARG